MHKSSKTDGGKRNTPRMVHARNLSFVCLFIDHSISKGEATVIEKRNTQPESCASDLHLEIGERCSHYLGVAQANVTQTLVWKILL